LKDLVDGYYLEGTIFDKWDKNKKRGVGSAELDELISKISAFNLSK